jgi:hypothetical protein
MDGKGVATSIWISGQRVANADPGIVWVTAETSGGTVTATDFFYNSDNATDLSISNWNSAIRANGRDKFSATVQGLDLNGNPVVGGTKFNASAKYLAVGGGTFQDGFYSSTDLVEVVSVTLDEDLSTTGANDDGIGAYDTVTYWVPGGGSITVYCNLLTGDAYRKSSSIESPTTAQPGEVINLSVTVVDISGNPLADHTLNMTAGSGVVGGATQETDPIGEAFGFTWTAPALDGDYNVVVTDTDPRGSGMVLTQKITVKAAAK